MSKDILERLIAPPIMAANCEGARVAAGVICAARQAGHPDPDRVKLLGDGSIVLSWRRRRRSFKMEFTYSGRILPFIRHGPDDSPPDTLFMSTTEAEVGHVLTWLEGTPNG